MSETSARGMAKFTGSVSHRILAALESGIETPLLSSEVFSGGDKCYPEKSVCNIIRSRLVARMGSADRNQPISPPQE